LIQRIYITRQINQEESYSVLALITEKRVLVNFNGRDAEVTSSATGSALVEEAYGHETERDFWRAIFSERIPSDPLETPQHCSGHFFALWFSCNRPERDVAIVFI
jgi:hypothetical protein